MRIPERGISKPGEPARMPAVGRICGEQHGPDGCEQPVFSRGLCRRHYRRLARGLPLVDPLDEMVGAPDGFGRWGFVDQDASGLLVCHECGRSFRSLAVHVGIVHSSVREYRDAHGLPSSVRLITEDLHDLISGDPTGPVRTARIKQVSLRGAALEGADQRVATEHGRWSDAIKRAQT